VAELAGTEVKVKCAACGNELDVTGREAFSTLPCPHCGAQLTVPMPFAHFLLLSVIGTGGIGAVYRAMDLTLHRYVAIKLLKRELAEDKNFIADFSREARAAAALNHQHIAQVYSFGVHDNQYYLVMELVEHGSLDSLIDERKRLTEYEALEYGIQIASALGAAHARGMVHRDIKPGNMLISNDGTAKLVDFGLAKFKDWEHGSDKAGSILATPYYLAPEKLQGHTEDFRSDMYSLGGTIFHCIAGRPPFDAPTAAEVIEKNLSTEPPSIKSFAPQVSDATTQIIARLLKKNPAERYQTYDELIRDLKAAKARATHGAPKAQAELKEKNSLALVLQIVGLAVLAAVTVGLVWANWDKIFPSDKPQNPQAPTQTPVAHNNSGGAQPPSRVPTPQARENFVKANQLLNLAMFGEAGQSYSAAENDLRDWPAERDWAKYMRAMAWLLTGYPDRASDSLEAFTATIKNPQLPNRVEYDDLPRHLSFLVADKLAPADYEAKLPQWQPWAQAAYHLTRGTKDYARGRFAEAAKAYRAYLAVAAGSDHLWLHDFQKLASRMADELEIVSTTVARVRELQRDNKPDKALEELDRGRLKIPSALQPVRRQLSALETELQSALDQRQKAERQARLLEEQRIKAAQDNQRRTELRMLAEIEERIADPIRTMNYVGALAEYQRFQGKLTLDDNKATYERGLLSVQQLVSFKSQLIADINNAPYEKGDLRTLKNEVLRGSVNRADHEKITITIIVPGGSAEDTAKWIDLSPSSIGKLAEHYLTIAAKRNPPPAELSARYFSLAMFYRFNGFSRDAESNAREAVRLNPTLKENAVKIFGASVFP
jgi:serine/threonine protein kinase